jgi:hypothetical protein
MLSFDPGRYCNGSCPLPAAFASCRGVDTGPAMISRESACSREGSIGGVRGRGLLEIACCWVMGAKAAVIPRSDRDGLGLIRSSPGRPPCSDGATVPKLSCSLSYVCSVLVLLSWNPSPPSASCFRLPTTGLAAGWIIGAGAPMTSGWGIDRGIGKGPCPCPSAGTGPGPGPGPSEDIEETETGEDAALRSPPPYGATW